MTYLKKIFFILTCLVFINPLYSQSVDELDKRNGFQDIKMATNINDYPGLEYKKDVADDIFPNTRLYTTKKGFYEKIGSLKIYDLEVKTYNDSIYEIRVITEKDPNLYKGLKDIYGEPEYSYRAGTSQWNGSNLRLSYSSHSKNKMELKYYSFVMVTQLKNDKRKVVEEIADDF